MKRRLLLLLACVFLLIFAAAASEGAESSKAEEKEHNYTEEEYKRIYSYREHIKNMTVNAEINKDGTITINEEIDYFFSSGMKHGIYRIIPLSYPGGAKSDISVKMNYITRNGKQEKYKAVYEDGTVNFRIGNAKAYVTGMNKYVLNYTVFGAVTEKGGNRYEIDWNAVGQSWTCDILDSEVNISFEGNKKIFSKGTKLEIYTCAFNEKGKDYTYIMEPDIIRISAAKILEKNNGLSIFLNFETDEIHISTLKKLEGFIYKNELLALSVIFLLSFLIFMLLRLLTLKKDPEIDKASYGKIPNKLSPMFTAFLKNEKKMENIISIGVLSLISKKHLKLHPDISDDAFELLNSEEALTEEERLLKTTLERQKFSQREVETIFENKINDLLRESGLDLDEEKLNKLKKAAEKGESRKINKFSNIPEDYFYTFQNNLNKRLINKKMEMMVKDTFVYFFAILITGLIVFAEYKIGYMITKDHIGGIVIAVNFGIWTMIGLSMFVFGNPSKRSWIWGAAIGILLFAATQNVFLLGVWCLFGYAYSKYTNLKKRYTEYGVCINYELENIEASVNNYKSDVRNILSSEEMTGYIDKIYPYIAALDLTYGMEKLMESISLNSYISHDEINNNFRSRYRADTIRTHVIRSYSSAVSSHESSSGSGGSYSSGGHSSGGGHGGGGGGSW